MTWVKICGTTSLDDAQISVAAGADALGFIFAPSPRQVEVTQAAEITAALPPYVEKIGVFVNELPARVAEVAVQAGLTGVQLHGDEAAEELPRFRQALGRHKIIKTLQARSLLNVTVGDVSLFLQSKGNIDAILLDSGSSKRRGGTGTPFLWEKAVPLAKSIQVTMPLIIAGGLSAVNVGDAIQLFSPWGVDVVSGVEREPGKKDETKVREFVAAVRQREAIAG
ncbi:MAG: phosphoribosylanthranilate isomerase [Candidatus Korobacteraceae bacterium]